MKLQVIAAVRCIVGRINSEHEHIELRYRISCRRLCLFKIVCTPLEVVYIDLSVSI